MLGGTSNHSVTLMSVVREQIVISVRNCRGFSLDEINHNDKKLTAFWTTNLSHCLRGTFNKNIPALYTKMTCDDARSSKLRNEFERLQNSELNRILYLAMSVLG